MVSDAAATKAPIAKIADKVSGVFVPTVIAIAAVTTACVAAAGHGRWLCAGARHFGAGDQLPLRAGSGHAGSHHGGQRPGREERHSVQDRRIPGGSRDASQIVALDKTGTITAGEPRVTDILPAEGVSADELLRLAYALERKSEHPLARAILQPRRGAGYAA